MSNQDGFCSECRAVEAEQLQLAAPPCVAGPCQRCGGLAGYAHWALCNGCVALGLCKRCGRERDDAPEASRRDGRGAPPESW